MATISDNIQPEDSFSLTKEYLSSEEGTLSNTKTSSPKFFLFSNPRSLSTLFEKCMLERGDLKVIHEPFNARYWFKNNGPSGFEGFIPSFAKLDTHKDIIKYLDEEARQSPIFVKDFAFTTHKDLLSDDTFFKDSSKRFIILIRDPAKTILSFYKKFPAYTSIAIDYENLFNIYKKISTVTGKPPLIIDADDFQNFPEQIMGIFCKTFNLPFNPESLKWEKGEVPKQFLPAQSWYQGVIDSKDIKETNIKGSIELLEAISDKKEREKMLDHYKRQFPFYKLLHDKRVLITS